MKKIFTIFFSFATAFSFSQVVAYYPLNGNANDASGNNKNGTVTGPTATNDRNNTPNSAMAFTSPTDEIKVTDTTGFNNDNGSVSVAAWFKNNVATGINPIISTGMQGFQKGIYLCVNYLNADGRIVFAMAANPLSIANCIFIQSDTNTYNDNQWHHVAVTVDKTNNKVNMYIDGVKAKMDKYTAFGNTAGILTNGNTDLDITGVVSSSKPSQAFVGLGTASGSGQQWQNGVLDEIYYYKGVFSSTQVQTLYNGGVIGVNDIAANNKSVSIYPNPAANKLHIKNETLETLSYSVFDVQGKLVKENSTSGLYTNVDLVELESGMYFIQFSNGQKLKFVKE